MFRQSLLLILLIFSFFILTACVKEEPVSFRQVPEVLLASDCGFDKLKCCASEPACTYGQQCCIDPNNSERNYCADDCSCGGNEEFCCSGDKCGDNGVCQAGICFACGEKNQPCCQSGAECSGNLLCRGGHCAECGIEGGPCCLSGEKCSAESGGRAECINDTCQKCGFDGNQPCREGDKCLPGQIFAGKTCERCGGHNQPCCAENSTSVYVCDPTKGLKCELGFCGK